MPSTSEPGRASGPPRPSRPPAGSARPLLLRPAVVAIDAVPTMASLDPVADVLERAGLPDEALDLFLGRVLKDAFALELAGVMRPFDDLARAALGSTLEALERGPDDALVERVVAMFASLPLFGDARPALERLRAEGLRVVVLTNAARAATEQLLARGGLQPLVEAVISPESSGHYRPSRAAYLHAARAVETVPGHIVHVAAESWDVQGAKAAGLRGAWVRRHEHAPNPLMSAPDLGADDLLALADALCALPRRPQSE